MFVSVIIPSRNEPLLDKLTRDIHKELSHTAHEVIIVEKGDKLPEIENAKAFRQQSDGLGNAVLEGVQKSRGDVIVTMDGDFSHRPKDLPRLIEAVKKDDIVIGSRFVEEGRTTDTRCRRIMSLLFRKFASYILDLSVQDNMSGFAAIRKKVYNNIALNPLGYKINLEIMCKGKRKGYMIKEVPIVFNKRKAGKSHAGIREAFRIIRLVFRLRFETVRNSDKHTNFNSRQQ